MGKEHMSDMHSGVLFSHKEEITHVIQRKLDGPKGHHVKLAGERKTSSKCFVDSGIAAGNLFIKF